MARIRSIHPGIWTDNDFVSVSMKAGQLFIGLLNFADDAGIFEWIERTLKAKIFPTRRLVIKKLLTELVDQGMIIQYEVDGKLYGEIRNFTKWQSPKNPVYKYPENPSKVDHNSHESSVKVAQKLHESSVKVNSDIKKDNENNSLQKKLSTGKERKGEERKGKNPPNPQPIETAGEVISIHTHNYFSTQILSLLKDHTNLPEQECREHIKQWIEKMGNAKVVIDLVKSGIGKGDPISYISKCVENEAKKHISSPEQEKSNSSLDVLKAKFKDDPDFQKLNRENQTQVLLLLKETPAAWFLKHCENHAPDAWKYYQKYQQKQAKVA